MELKDYPSSAADLKLEEQRALVRNGIFALAGFIAVKVALTYVIYRATHRE